MELPAVQLVKSESGHPGPCFASSSNVLLGTTSESGIVLVFFCVLP